jgi:hypothetical protein
MAPHTHASTDPQPHRVHSDDGNSTTPLLTALTGLSVLLITSLAAIAFAVGRRISGLDLGWPHPLTVICILAAFAAAVLVGSAVLAAVMLPDRPRSRRRRC